MRCKEIWNELAELLITRLSYVFNPPDNPYDTADKWLVKENLPLSYRQQIVEFILQNSGQKAFTPDPTFRDPYTGGKYLSFGSLR